MTPDQAKRRAYYEANREVIKARSKQWKKTNREQFNTWARKNRKEWTPEQRKLRALIQRRALMKKLYGITQERYDEMFKAQGGVCKLCQKPNPLSRRTLTPLDVDHNHATGKVRGLLCSPCNRSLGHFDDPETLQRLVAYLD